MFRSHSKKLGRWELERILNNTKCPVTIFETDAFADQPAICKGLQLYPHQLKSIYRMLKLERSGRIEVKFADLLNAHNGRDDEDEHKVEGKEEEKREILEEDEDAVDLIKEEDEIEDEEKIFTEFTHPNPSYDEQKISQIQSRVGILANKPGSGKSAVVLSLCGIPCNAQNAINFEKCNGYSSIQYHFGIDDGRIKQLKANIIVCNPKLIMQWADYMKLFSLKHVVINMERRAPQTVEEMIEMGNKFDVIFVSSSFLWAVGRFFPRVKFQRIFFDEVDSMEFPHCTNIEVIHANFIWWVTATPEQLIASNTTSNFKGFLQSMVSFHLPLFRNIYTVKCSAEEIDASILIPPYELQDVIVLNSTAIRLAAGIVEDQTLSHYLQGDRIDQAIQRLNVTGQTMTTLSEALTIYLENHIHNRNADIAFAEKKLLEEGLTEAERVRYERRIEHLQLEIQGYERKKEILLDRIKSTTDCLICYDGLTNPVATKCCTQPFCFECLQGWLKYKRSCPNCRSRMDGNIDIISQPHVKAEIKIEEKKRKRQQDAEEELSKKRARLEEERKAAEQQPRTKVQALLKVLENSKKSLLYVEDVNQAKGSEEALVAAGFKVFKVIGLRGVGTMRVLETMKKSNEKTCLMVSSITQSAGFNLQFVDSIVMYQRMKEREAQIIGRGMRPGRTEPLKVYRILYESEK